MARLARREVLKDTVKRGRGRPKKTFKMQLVGLRLTWGVHAALTHDAKRQGRKVNDLIREAIDEWLLRHPRRAKIKKAVEKKYRNVLRNKRAPKLKKKQ